MVDMSYGKCNQCIKFGTPKCPTSALCLKYEERPYFEPKEKGRSNMWNKIKQWFTPVLAGITALLLWIISLKNKKIKKTEEKLDTAEKNLEVIEEIHRTEEKLQEVSESVEKDTSEKIQEVKKEIAQKLSEVSGSETVSGSDYNKLIGEWNDEN